MATEVVPDFDPSRKNDSQHLVEKDHHPERILEHGREAEAPAAPQRPGRIVCAGEGKSPQGHMATRPHSTTLSLPRASKAPRREVSRSLWFIQWEKGTWGYNKAPRHCGSFVGYPNPLSHGGDYGGKVQGLTTGNVDCEGEVAEGLATAALGPRQTKFISAVPK